MRTTTVTQGMLALSLAAIALTGTAAQADPTAAPGYTVSTFGAAPTGASNPDSIAIDGGNVFIGYADNSIKTGGGTSTIAEFSASGALENTFSVSGHNDGLRVDPSTHLLWAMQNEDGNPNLSIINPTNGIASTYTLPSSNSGGGYDDIVFQNGNVYFSASNAQLDPNTDPVIVKATLSGGAFTFAPILEGNATAADPTGAATTLNLTDADSLTTTPAGNLLLTDQTANELITVTNTGAASQTVSFVPTTSGGASIAVDDTIFTGLTPGMLLVSDTNADTVYAIQWPFSGGVFSAAPDAGFVGSLDYVTGEVTPIVSGFGAPKGMAFLPRAVPEPSGLAAFGIGLLALLGCAAKRRRLAV